ncbi:acetyl-CoA carboxylase biotin carboxyl carrier protein [Streptococcus parasuis]|uniref:Biotin carboxyl carrier protein of acetyl-CoA carboxylase n=1 Tax=Streptococcus parasuis TaxID=1501662 RepID=A0A4Q8L1R1_9STRE|nr:acetyl-CoA carboxylase biotin carboxyl carrier protein [Streptococcus parasuis]MDG3145658.1 acetyl-CoA carboxylase biotin carboxyl carrier protein [Streptococcus suis]MDG3181243.1 acetyl-CoA carboxylase biotin carboxyl carrier protein [Streptococcus suis]MDG3213949.1 acetyl-CoA carboxylase biotin carboxyl carrier protein [Streptococcus suis]TAA11642.1 acetyl-CoA carboxylase biotin carboxyl carrier protein [Streptococcus parasuis]WDM37852.1 acetyl-CoA carboxylase biotin carboxyl carrier prot
MNITEIKDLMSQFDQSSLREFSYSNAGETLHFSKNQQAIAAPSPKVEAPLAPVASASPAVPAAETSEPAPTEASVSPVAEGAVVESPLVGVAYLSPSPDKPAFVAVGDTVKKGQTLMIIEAMKVMNEVPADRDGVVTEILVANQDVVEYGQGLVRIK